MPVPAGLDYLGFQKGGIAKVLEVRNSAILADVLRLGITVQGIDIYKGIAHENIEMKDVPVLCQANMKIKWCREFDEWGTVEGATSGWAEGSKVPETDIVACNYDIAERNIGALRKRKWKLILTDEVHNLWNEETKQAQALLGDLTQIDRPRGLPLAKGGLKVHLAGTPPPRSIADL